MPQDQRESEKFSLKDIIKRKISKQSEQPLPEFGFPEIKILPTETEQPKEQTEQPEEKLDKIDKERAQKITGGGAGSSASPALDEQEREIKKVENILQKGLKDIYLKMDPITRQQFKTQGEDTARAVNVLLQKTKVKIKEVVNLIVKWLKLIPGVNKFFVEQEAKIRADKLMARKRSKISKL